jgi:hypothetical protein
MRRSELPCLWQPQKPATGGLERRPSLMQRWLSAATQGEQRRERLAGTVPHGHMLRVFIRRAGQQAGPVLSATQSGCLNQTGIHGLSTLCAEQYAPLECINYTAGGTG